MLYVGIFRQRHQCQNQIFSNWIYFNMEILSTLKIITLQLITSHILTSTKSKDKLQWKQVSRHHICLINYETETKKNTSYLPCKTISSFGRWPQGARSHSDSLFHEVIFESILLQELPDKMTALFIDSTGIKIFQNGIFN